jgi:hypothetical protein
MKIRLKNSGIYLENVGKRKYNGIISLVKKLRLDLKLNFFKTGIQVIQADISMLDTMKFAKVYKRSKKIIFDLSTEALQFIPDDGYLSKKLIGFHKNLNQINPNVKIYFLNANINSTSAYENWCKRNQIRLRISLIGFHFYFPALWSDVNVFFSKNNLGHKILSQAFKSIKNQELRSKHFTCLNHRPRAHRYATVLYLLHLSSCEKGIISFAGYELGRVDAPTVDNMDEVVKFIGSLSNGPELIKCLGVLNSKSPMSVDRAPEVIQHELWGKETGSVAQSLGINDFGLDESIHDSYFEFVTETWFTDDSCLYLTEKTFRPIITLKPFIIIGSPFSLKALKKLGFKTFSSIINEAYDEEVIPSRRMELIQEEIRKIIKSDANEIHNLYIKIWPILEYNYLHFINNGYKISESIIKEEVFSLVVD